MLKRSSPPAEATAPRTFRNVAVGNSPRYVRLVLRVRHAVLQIVHGAVTRGARRHCCLASEAGNRGFAAGILVRNTPLVQYARDGWGTEHRRSEASWTR